eukprot:759906-Hanusia_phi.AAC.1
MPGCRRAIGLSSEPESRAPGLAARRRGPLSGSSELRKARRRRSSAACTVPVRVMSSVAGIETRNKGWGGRQGTRLRAGSRWSTWSDR